jgi:hypothetical protein
MRMWMVNPSKLCRQHLLGEHNEVHMLAGSMNKLRSIQGFIDNKLVDPMHVTARHNALAKEMESRGYHHGSPIGMVIIQSNYMGHWVDVQESITELKHRCGECRANLQRTPAGE